MGSDLIFNYEDLEVRVLSMLTSSTYLILRQYGALNHTALREKLNERLNTESPRLGKVSQAAMLELLAAGSKLGYFEYSERVNRWLVGERSPL